MIRDSEPDTAEQLDADDTNKASVKNEFEDLIESQPDETKEISVDKTEGIANGRSKHDAEPTLNDLMDLQAAPKFTVEQLMNTDLLLSGQMFEVGNKQREKLLKGTLSDFTLSSIHSIVPLMNLAELFLLSSSSSVVSI